MKVSFIGAGNLAWHLAQGLDQAGHKVGEVYSRQIRHAEELCNKLYNANPTASLDFTSSASGVFIIAVKDDAIESVIQEIKLPPNSTLVHTSGTKSIDVFSKLIGTNTGVFYPLQTFSKSKPIHLKSVPICIEASDENTEKILEKLAFSICENVCFYNSEDRRKLHLAAVFACNFSNHMITIAKDICVENGLELAVLHPLIKETFEKAILVGSDKSQTGPAVRGDMKTLNEHMDLLGDESIKGKIYELISQSILERYRSKS